MQDPGVHAKVVAPDGNSQLGDDSGRRQEWVHKKWQTTTFCTRCGAPLLSVHMYRKDQDGAMLGNVRGQQRRRAILHAAIQVVAQSGAGSLTHRSTAAEAGVSLASVTYHFPGISDLRKATLTHAAQVIGSELAGTLGFRAGGGGAGRAGAGQSRSKPECRRGGGSGSSPSLRPERDRTFRRTGCREPTTSPRNRRDIPTE